MCCFDYQSGAPSTPPTTTASGKLLALSKEEVKEVKSLNLINDGMHQLMARMNTPAALKHGIPAPELLVMAKEVVDPAIVNVDALEQLLLPLIKLSIIKKVSPRRPRAVDAGPPPPLPPVRFKLHKQWPFNLKPQPTILCMKAGTDIVHMPPLLWKMTDVATALRRNDEPAVFWAEFHKILRNMERIHTKDYAAVKSAFEKRLRDLCGRGFPAAPSVSLPARERTTSDESLDRSLLHLVQRGPQRGAGRKVAQQAEPTPNSGR